MRRPFEALALVAILSASGLPSAEAAKGALLVLNLEAAELPEELVSFLDKEVREEVQATVGARLKVMPKPELAFSGMRLASGCVDEGPDCLAIIGRTLGASHVLRVTITGDQRSAKIRFVLLDVAAGRPRVQAVDLADITRESAVELRVHVARALGAKRDLPAGSIALTSEGGALEGTEILLDDQRVAQSGLAAVPAGDHKLEVRRRGFEPFVWRGAVRPGKETRVAVELRPASPAAAAAVAPAASPSPTPDIDAAPEPGGPVVAAPVAEPARGPNYLLPAIVGGAAVVAGLVALVQGLRMLSIESELESFCRVPENVEACMPDACKGRPEDCDSGRTAEISRNVALGVAGALAVGSVVLYFVESNSVDDDPDSFSATFSTSGGRASLNVRF